MKKRVYVGWAGKTAPIGKLFRWESYMSGDQLKHEYHGLRKSKRDESHWGFRGEDWPPKKYKITIEQVSDNFRAPICDRDDIGLNGSSNDGIDCRIKLPKGSGAVKEPTKVVCKRLSLLPDIRRGEDSRTRNMPSLPY